MKEKTMKRTRKECGEDKEWERTSAHRFRQSTEEVLGVWLLVCSHGICCFDSLCHHHLHLSALRSAPWLSVPSLPLICPLFKTALGFPLYGDKVAIRWRLQLNVKFGKGQSSRHCRLPNNLINARSLLTGVQILFIMWENWQFYSFRCH